MNGDQITLVLAILFAIWLLLMLIQEKYQSKFLEFLQLTLFYFFCWPFLLVGVLFIMILAYIGESNKKRRYEEYSERGP
ncbi:MAG: hypothetical protein NZ730_09210 [Porticoccaceae bacterium]|nr:hypothetical protein [Porticoccaceae bacterium]